MSFVHRHERVNYTIDKKKEKKKRKIEIDVSSIDGVTIRRDIIAFSGATIIVINDCRGRFDRSINLPLLSRL